MVESKSARKVALFGGTFDPVHNGHLEVAERAVEALSLDLVVFLPCRQSPHKSIAAGASEEQRLEMLRLATKALSWVEVSDWEFHQPIPSYSWRTAEAFTEKYPRTQLYWLMGQDQWKVLSSWSRAEYLASLVQFIVHDRDGTTNTGAEGAHFISGDHPASSSQIRASILADKKIHEPWLAPDVLSYLQKEELYRE